MKVVFLLGFSILAASAESFRISGVSLPFKEVDGVLFYCENSCQALKEVNNSRNIASDTREESEHALPLGSKVCLEVYKAKTILGVNYRGDGRAFCVFNDESLVELNSLTSHLKMKK